MSDNLSNESPTSLRRSSVLSRDKNLPGLIVIYEERLSTFAKAATTLSHTTIKTEDKPLSFHLTIATQEAEQDFPPISPCTAEVLLQTYPNINNAIHAVTFRLIATIHCCTLAASQELNQS